MKLGSIYVDHAGKHAWLFDQCAESDQPFDCSDIVHTSLPYISPIHEIVPNTAWGRFALMHPRAPRSPMPRSVPAHTRVRPPGPGLALGHAPHWASLLQI